MKNQIEGLLLNYILPKFDLKIKSNIFERTPHLRKGSSDVYKTDLEEIYTFIENLID